MADSWLEEMQQWLAADKAKQAQMDYWNTAPLNELLRHFSGDPIGQDWRARVAQGDYAGGSNWSGPAAQGTFSQTGTGEMGPSIGTDAMGVPRYAGPPPDWVPSGQHGGNQSGWAGSQDTSPDRVNQYAPGYRPSIGSMTPEEQAREDEAWVINDRFNQEQENLKNARQDAATLQRGGSKYSPEDIAWAKSHNIDLGQAPENPLPEPVTKQEYADTQRAYDLYNQRRIGPQDAEAKKINQYLKEEDKSAPNWTPAPAVAAPKPTNGAGYMMPTGDENYGVLQYLTDSLRHNDEMTKRPFSGEINDPAVFAWLTNKAHGLGMAAAMAGGPTSLAAPRMGPLPEPPFPYRPRSGFMNAEPRVPYRPRSGFLEPDVPPEPSPVLPPTPSMSWEGLPTNTAFNNVPINRVPVGKNTAIDSYLYSLLKPYFERIGR